MVSLRFPFLFSPPIQPPSSVSRPFSAAYTVGYAATGFAAGVAISHTKEIKENPIFLDALNLIYSNLIPQHCSFPPWSSISLADNSPTVVESKTGTSFPSVLSGSRRLLGIGLRKKRILGLKNIDVYAFGVYVDNNDIKKLVGERYENLSTPEVEGNNFSEDLMEGDMRITIRLQIVYDRLSIRSVRNAFEESIGNRLEKLGGTANKELLQRFTSQFKDEYKIPEGSSIELSREEGHVLRTRIDEKEVGRIESQLLCRSILDLYIGKDSFDEKAKKDIELNLAYLLRK